MRRRHCQLPAYAMLKLYYSLVYSHLLTWGRSGRTNVAKIGCAPRRAQTITSLLTFHSIYDFFALLKAFNANTCNFHQYFKNKLSSHESSHLHNTRYRKHCNFNTPHFNHSKTQKCYLYQLIPVWNSLPSSLKIAVRS